MAADKYKFPVLKLLFLLAYSSYSQEFYQTIKGVVVDKHSQSPLPGVVVYVVGEESKGSTTDVNGSYKIKEIPIGRVILVAQLSGYKPRQNWVVLNSGKEAVINIELEENVISGQEVEVISQQDKTKSNNRMSTVSSRIFSSEEAGRYAGSRNDPARMAANFAGVSGANDSRNDIIIRGNSPLGILWRLNGLDIPNPNHFGNSGSTGGPISILNNNTLDNSDFMSGAFAADYANATAGVFDLKMRQGNNEKYEFLAQVGFNGFELGAEGPFNKKQNNSFLVNYRYSTLSVFKALNIDFGTGSAVPQYQDLTFKTDFQTKHAGKFSWWGIGGLSNVVLLEKDKKPGKDLYGYKSRDLYFISNVGSSGISHHLLFKNNSYLKTNIGISGQLNQIKSDRIDTSFKTPNNTKPEYRSSTKNIIYSANTTYHKKVNSRNYFNTGIYLDTYQSFFIDSLDKAFGFNTFNTLRDYKGTSSLARAFFQWQHKFYERITLNGGVSSQYFFLNGKYSIEPRVGIKYQFREKQWFSLGGGMHSQIQPLYLYFAGKTLPSGERIETNKNLDFTRAIHAVLAYDCNLAENFRLKAESYYQYLYSVPIHTYSSVFSAVNLGADFESPNVVDLKSGGLGYNYGLEFTLEKFYSKGYYFLLTASLFESKYRASDEIWRNTAFNGNYVFNLLGGKELKIGRKCLLMADTRLTLAGGKRYIPINLEASNMAGQEIRNFNQAYVNQYPYYFRIDIKPGFKLNTQRYTHEWSIDIQNITRRKNIFQETYDAMNQRIQTDYQLRFFIIPQYRLLF